MAEEGTIRDRARAARARRGEAAQREQLEQHHHQIRRTLPLVNRLMGTSLTVDDLPQVVTREGDGKSRLEYRFKVDDADFALTGDGSLIILGRCALCTELVPAGRIPLDIDIAIEETGGEFDPEDTLVKIADFMDTEVYCWYHREPEKPEYTELEQRVRQIAREEIDAAGLADDYHSHPELAGEHHEH